MIEWSCDSFFDGHNSHLAVSLIEIAHDAGVESFTLHKSRQNNFCVS